MGQTNRRTTKIRPNAVGSDIFGRFPNFDKYKCRSEVAGDVMSDVAVHMSAWMPVRYLVNLG